MRWIQDREPPYKLLTEAEFNAKYYRETEKTHFVISDDLEYHSPVTGKLIHGKVQRRADLKNSGCRPWEGIEQERNETESFRRQQDKEMDRKMFKAAEKAFMSLPESKRRELAGHLDY